MANSVKIIAADRLYDTTTTALVDGNVDTNATLGLESKLAAFVIDKTVVSVSVAATELFGPERYSATVIYIT